MYVVAYETSSKTGNFYYTMRCLWIMFVTAVCFLFLLNELLSPNMSTQHIATLLGATYYVPVNSKTAHPPPRAIPGHLTRVKLRTVGNLTQSEARPVGHLAFVSKRLSAVGSKRILQFFDSAREPRSRVIALVDST